MQLNTSSSSLLLGPLPGQTSCAICLEDYNLEGNVCLLTKCRHVFDHNCLDGWLIEHETCPKCVSRVVRIDLSAGELMNLMVQQVINIWISTFVIGMGVAYYLMEKASTEVRDVFMDRDSSMLKMITAFFKIYVLYFLTDVPTWVERRTPLKTKLILGSGLIVTGIFVSSAVAIKNVYLMYKDRKQNCEFQPTLINYKPTLENVSE